MASQFENISNDLLWEITRTWTLHAQNDEQGCEKAGMKEYEY